jgi:hypothetical protein
MRGVQLSSNGLTIICATITLTEVTISNHHDSIKANTNEVIAISIVKIK